jgi:hypothetical protein
MVLFYKMVSNFAMLSVKAVEICTKNVHKNEKKLPIFTINIEKLVLVTCIFY